MDNQSALKPIGLELVDRHDPNGLSYALKGHAWRNLPVLKSQLPVDFPRKLAGLSQISQLHHVDGGFTSGHCP
ncbi:hypothetical protein D3C87_1582250 [compost metagenome]